jgi:serine/threonine-protein kinase RsbW
MEFNLGLVLPRDGRTVPVARHICRNALYELGVADECVSDIEVALTEACTNVLEHSGPGEEYEVQVRMAEHHCVIRVVDSGRGFDAAAPRALADASAEGGRGIDLMHALVDRVELVSRPEAGTVVVLEKELAYVEGSPVKKLAARGGRVALGD